ncbi:MAG: M23 family metallopeptidase [Nocardioidaceae bacterium]
MAGHHGGKRAASVTPDSVSRAGGATVAGKRRASIPSVSVAPTAVLPPQHTPQFIDVVPALDAAAAIPDNATNTPPGHAPSHLLSNAPGDTEPTIVIPRIADKPRGGARRAQRRRKTSDSPLRLPSVPALVGTAALVAAAAGALTVGTTASTTLAASSVQRLAGQANVLNGASGIGSSNPLRDRKLAVSRDSAREAEQNAEQKQLLKAAEQKNAERTVAIDNLAARTEAFAVEKAKNAWQLPIPTGVYHLTAGFGQCSGLWSHCHTGLDFAAPSGTPIHAIANGVVVSAGYDGAYGNKTVIQLEDGTEIWYCHQTSYAVSAGDQVIGGQVIGYVGSTGNTTGPHLHLEVHPGAGDPVDPYPALIAHGVTP